MRPLRVCLFFFLLWGFGELYRRMLCGYESASNHSRILRLAASPRAARAIQKSGGLSTH
jgi:hypothetical protein